MALGVVLEEEWRRIRVLADRRGRSIRGTCRPSGCTCRSFQRRFDQWVLREVFVVEVAIAVAAVVVEEVFAGGIAWVKAGYVQEGFPPSRRVTAAVEEEMLVRAVQEVH